MSRLTVIQWTGWAAVVFGALIGGTSQATEPIHTLPDTGLLRIGEQLISLYGVRLPAPDQMCEEGDVPWHCGTIAWQALDQHLSDTELECVYQPLLSSSGGSTLNAECWIGEQNLNSWLVGSGWALTVGYTESAYYTDERLAQKKNLGLWRGGFVPPDGWRPTRLGEDSACSACTARHQSIIRTREKKRKLDEAAPP